MNIELRRISFSPRLSEETNAYAAEVWVDGVHIADVSNDGHGGPDRQYHAKGKTHADVEALDARVKAEYGKRTTDLTLHGEPFEYEINLEHLCGDLLMEHVATRDLRRVLKRTVAFVKPGTKGVMTYKGKIEGAARAHLITETLRKYPGAQILNNMPFADALGLFRREG